MGFRADVCCFDDDGRYRQHGEKATQVFACPIVEYEVKITMYALIIPFFLIGYLAFLHTFSFDLSLQAGGSPISQSAQSDTLPQVEDFIATSHAVLNFAENNVGYSGTIDAQQLQPYMGNMSFPTQWNASMQNGLTLVWSDALPTGSLSGIASATQTDCAYAQVIQGEMQSECGANMGTAPYGVTEGSIIYAVENPV